MFLFPLFQLALGTEARRFHVSAAFSAKAKVAMSRFEPDSTINYEKMHENISIVRRRLAVHPFFKILFNIPNMDLCVLQFDLWKMAGVYYSCMVNLLTSWLDKARDKRPTWPFFCFFCIVLFFFTEFTTCCNPEIRKAFLLFFIQLLGTKRDNYFWCSPVIPENRRFEVNLKKRKMKSIPQKSTLY